MPFRLEWRLQAPEGRLLYFPIAVAPGPLAQFLQAQRGCGAEQSLQRLSSTLAQCERVEEVSENYLHLAQGKCLSRHPGTCNRAARRVSGQLTSQAMSREKLQAGLERVDKRHPLVSTHHNCQHGCAGNPCVAAHGSAAPPPPAPSPSPSPSPMLPV